MTNFSRYIDSLIAWKPIDYDGSYWAQCVDSARAISEHLGYPITSRGNAWDIYLKGSVGYTKKVPGSYIPLPGDLIFMSPTPANWKVGHIATADIGCTMASYRVIHQNYGIQWSSGSGKWDRHLKRQIIPAQRWSGILARNIPFEIKNV
jgi:CHAP domain